MSSLAEQLPQHGARQTLLAMEKLTPNSRDRVPYLLNRGRLKRLTGDFKGSITDLQQAKAIMTALQAQSVTENLSAVTIAETLRSYVGTPSERVLVHVLLAFNYLNLGQLDSARVEMLQADVTMKQLAKADSLSGQLASAHFVAGLVYELGGEWDDAMISYRRAAKIMQKRQQVLPPALENSLLQVSLRQGLTQDYQDYVKQFSREATTFNKGDSELIVVYTDGNVTAMQQHIVRVYSDRKKQLLSLALPFYPPANYRPYFYTVNVAGHYSSTRVLENIEQLVRADLDRRIPQITVTAMARAALKYEAVDNAQKQGDFAKVLMNVATAITEIADTRSWSMLPSSVQIARIKVVDSEYGSMSAIRKSINEKHIISFKKANKKLLFVSSVN